MEQDGKLFDDEPKETLLACAQRIDDMARSLIVEVGKFRERLLSTVSTAPATEPEKKHNMPKALLTYFDLRHFGRFNEPAKIDGSIDGPIMARLGKTYGEEKTRRLIDRFFELDDDFVVRAGFTVRIFSSKVAGIISSDATPTRVMGSSARTRDNGRNAAQGASMIRQAHAR